MADRCSLGDELHRPPARTATNVTVMADFFLGFYHTAFFVAEEEGLDKAAGLNVTDYTGTGSDKTATQVSAGRYTFGLAGADASARAVSDGEAIHAVVLLVDNSGLCAVVRQNPRHHSISELAGKSYASVPARHDLVLPRSRRQPA